MAQLMVCKVEGTVRAGKKPLKISGKVDDGRQLAPSLRQKGSRSDWTRRSDRVIAPLDFD